MWVARSCECLSLALPLDAHQGTLLGPVLERNELDLIDVFDFVDPEQPSDRSRFYRAIAGPESGQVATVSDVCLHPATVPVRLLAKATRMLKPAAKASRSRV